MANNRPLQNLSDEELLQLWDTAEKVNDMGQETLDHIVGYSDSMLTPIDINYIRAGVLLQAKLCDKYGIPHPKIQLDLGEYEDQTEIEDADDEYDYEYDYEPYEWLSENLHCTMNHFASVDGIGDFEEEDLFFDEGILAPLLNEEEDAEEKVSDFLLDELTYTGYQSVLSLIREVGVDMVTVFELKLTKSKKMAALVAAIEKGTVPRPIVEFWDSFSVKMSTRAFFWTPLDNLEEVKEDLWCCVYAIVQHYEEGILVCDLYKHMSIRIGAYIAQEFAERYAS